MTHINSISLLTYFNLCHLQKSDQPLKTVLYLQSANQVPKERDKLLNKISLFNKLVVLIEL